VSGARGDLRRVGNREHLNPLGGELRQRAAHPVAECREVGNRHRVLLRGGAEREQPLLDAFELLRIEGGGDRPFETALALLERQHGAVKRRHRFVEEAARLGERATAANATPPPPQWGRAFGLSVAGSEATETLRPKG
jgi:hypothetical protein